MTDQKGKGVSDYIVKSSSGKIYGKERISELEQLFETAVRNAQTYIKERDEVVSALEKLLRSSLNDDHVAFVDAETIAWALIKKFRPTI